jgi:EAL domain-containing protein (putative c-di-GMP-specific phosphodiesterase class I)
MRLVVEGVETLEDAETVARLGCDVIQGYYYSRPIAADDFERWIVGRTSFPMALATPLLSLTPSILHP